MFTLVFVCFIVILVIGLSDFKYYRSVTKTQNVEAQKILTIIGEPNEEAIFTAIGVKHLSWTVLSYYYADKEINGVLPDEIKAKTDEIWAFIGYELLADSLQNSLEKMEQEGYSVTVYEGLWMGKYGCDLYHFTK